ncbi:MAG: hypothetical protein INR64_16090, partial [Caulobacteraceae bacterium]|nr:hypothetical protein [Caulobacter sp.]
MHDQVSALDGLAPDEVDGPAAPPSIAVIGMSGRFPKAPDLSAFWANLVAGRDCVTRHTLEELVQDGVNPMQAANPRYVPAKGTLEDATGFDAGLFGFSPREAEIIDPQQRAFLECALAALEDAGIDPERCAGTIGV